MRMDSESHVPKAWVGLLTVLVLQMGLSGCASHYQSAAEEQPTPAGFVEQTEDGFFLQPAPLYGSDELSIGAVQLSDGGQLLLLCDDTDRALNTGKPLVLYLDGEYLSLNWTESQIQAAVGCDAFRTDLETLDKVSTVERAMLRVHFTDETVEHRISGTTADYFSRPKMFGPQRSIGRFVEAVQQSVTADTLNADNIRTANSD